MQSMNCIYVCLLLDSLFSSIDRFLLLPIPYWINHSSFLLDLSNCCKSPLALFLRVALAIVGSVVILISRVSTWFCLRSPCYLFIFLRFSSLFSLSHLYLSHLFCFPTGFHLPVSFIPLLPFPYLPLSLFLFHKWCFNKYFLTWPVVNTLWHFQWMEFLRKRIYLIWAVLDCFPELAASVCILISSEWLFLYLHIPANAWQCPAFLLLVLMV